MLIFMPVCFQAFILDMNFASCNLLRLIMIFLSMWHYFKIVVELQNLNEKPDVRLFRTIYS